MCIPSSHWLVFTDRSPSQKSLSCGDCPFAMLFGWIPISEAAWEKQFSDVSRCPHWNSEAPMSLNVKIRLTIDLCVSSDSFPNEMIGLTLCVLSWCVFPFEKSMVIVVCFVMVIVLWFLHFCVVVFRPRSFSARVNGISLPLPKNNSPRDMEESLLSCASCLYR